MNITPTMLLMHIAAVYGVWWCMAWGVPLKAWILAGMFVAVDIWEIIDTRVGVWQKRYHWPGVIGGFVVPFVLAGWAGLFLAGCIRIVLCFHMTRVIESIRAPWLDASW